jgi:hypothetical protein
MKSTIWSLVAVAALAALGTTPAYAKGEPWYCDLPIIGQYLCPPKPGDGGHGRHSVPEPAAIAILAAGAGLVGAALRRRRAKK